MKNHPDKHIQAALEYARSNGWSLINIGKSRSEFCKIKYIIQKDVEHTHGIWLSPKSPENFAKQVRRKIDKFRPPLTALEGLTSPKLK